MLPSSSHRSPQPRHSAHSLSPLTATFNYTHMEMTRLLKWTLVLPFFLFLITFLTLSFSVQLSGLGGIGQSSASSSWKPGALDLAGRQRSSSDPPNMHPPVPPMRLISTGGMDPSRPLPPSSGAFLYACAGSARLGWTWRGRDLHFLYNGATRVTVCL